MNLEQIKAQQERMSKEGQTPPDGDYIATAINSLRVFKDKNDKRKLAVSFRVTDRVEGNELIPAYGYELVSVTKEFQGSNTLPSGDTIDNAASAVAFFTNLGVNAEGIAAIFETAASVQIADKSATLIGKDQALTDSDGNPVTFTSSVLLSVSTSSTGYTNGKVKRLPKKFA